MSQEDLDDTFEIFEGSHNWRTEIPNIVAELGLDPYSVSLYFHYKKIAGDKGRCIAKRTTIAEKAKIGITKQKECEQLLCSPIKELGGKSLIKIEYRIGSDGRTISNKVIIEDIWIENYQYNLNLYKDGLKKSLASRGATGVPSRSDGQEEDPISKKKTTNPTLPPQDGGLVGGFSEKIEKEEISKKVGSVGGFSEKQKKEEIPEFLKELKIQDVDKIRLSKMYSKEIIMKSITHCTKPEFVIKSTLDSAIFHFCKHPEQIVESVKEKEIRNQKEKDDIEAKIYFRRKKISEIRDNFWKNIREKCDTFRDNLEFLEVVTKDGRIKTKIFFSESGFDEMINNLFRTLEINITQIG